MRVAFIVNVFPALSETFILRQITGLIERGHKVDIFALSRTNETTVHRDVERFNLLAHTHYHLMPYRPTSSKLLRLAKRLRLLFRSFRKNPQAVLNSLDVTKFGKKALLLQVLCEITPFFGRGPYDILHCQFGTLGALGLLLRDTGIFRGKIVTSFRGYDVSSHTKTWGDNIYSDLFERGDLFLCVSERIRDQLATLGCDERKIIVHRSGVDVKKFHSPSRKPKSGKTRILSVARLVEKKGIEYGIQAVATIVEKRPHIEYVIAGGGPLKTKLQNIIHELKAGNHIKLIGWKSEDEIVELLMESDILLAPSLTTETGDEEGIPGAIMEAFAQGLPVVSTRHSAIPEVVQDGQSGFLVPERDAGALAKKLKFLIERPELRFTMGQNGRRFVEEHYNIDRLNDRLETLYRQLLHGEVTQSTFESLEPVPLRRQ